MDCISASEAIEMADLHFEREVLQRLTYPEDFCSPHKLDVNPEARLFRTTGPGSTELEYLQLLAALVGVFKPTHVLETGTLSGDGTIALMNGAEAGCTVISICGDALAPETRHRLHLAASTYRCRLITYTGWTTEMMAGRSQVSFADLCRGRVTFAFLDTRIPDRDDELLYIADSRNGVMDFSRPCCVCIHDMSRHRHERDADTEHLPTAAANIEAFAASQGWQILRLHQSRGMIVLCRYP
jgi:hypothetical protein